jgi:hypothetical protein
MNKWDISRRELLQGLGVGAGCLPLLNAGTAWAAGPGKAQHLVIIAATEGYRQGNWLPASGPLTGPLPRSCTGLEPFKSEVIFLPSMKNPAFTGCDRCGHGAYGSIYYGLAPRGGTGEYAEPNGATVDQVVAAAMPRTGRPSLALAVQIDLPPSNGGPGHNRAFWRAAQQPINPELDPYVTYGNIFAGAPAAGATAADDEAVKKLMLGKQSLLDYVGKSLTRFKTRLGKDDQGIVEGHLQSIRELEMQLQSQGNISGGKCGGAPGAMMDIKASANYPKILDAHLNMMLAALKCGVTQVATLQLADATGDSINFAFVPGIPARSPNNYKTPYRNWHDLGHNPVLGGVDHKQIVDQWWMDRYADFLGKMRATIEPGGGTMLDNSIVLWGNHMHEGADHGSQQIPWILAGKGGGYFKTGTCFASEGKNTTAVLADICGAMGVSQHPFGAAMGLGA